MTSPDFHDRLQRYLSGELSEADAARLYQELLSDPAALDAFLAARETDHDLKRLLSPGAGDDAFLRGLLNARAATRQDPEAFVKSVSRAHAGGARRKTVRALASRNWSPLALVAAGLLVGAFAWLFLSLKSQGPTIVRRDSPPEPVSLEAPAPDPLKARVPVPEPGRAPESVRPSQKAADPLPPPQPKPAAENPPRVEPERKSEEPKPAPPRPPAPATVVAFATLEKARGKVFVVSGGRSSPASDGQPLAAGEGVHTEGSQSGALLSRPDATRLTLGADTQMLFAASRPEVAVLQGRLEVELGPREPGNEVFFTTPHAEIRAREARLTLTIGPASTTLELQRGAALFTNVLDGKTLDVKPGQKIMAQEIPGVERKRVDEAIRKGVEHLKNATSQGAEVFRIANCDELILLTLLVSGVGDFDPAVQKYLKSVLVAPLGRTYNVTLQAMALEELDRVRYQDRIAECAQFLVDNQCANGQWTYFGDPSPVSLVTETPTAVATSSKEAGADLFGRRAKPGVVRKLQLKRARSGPAQGDNSNAQYAALGLRACSDAGVAIPVETLQSAAGWWRKTQYPEDAGRGVATGEAGPARGWCYNDGKNPVNGGPCCVGPYQSMTAGAISSLMIYHHLLGTDWKKDVNVRLGMNWLTNYFTVSRNLGMDVAFRSVNGGTTPPETYQYYSLYALERVGVFSGQEKMGRHSWYGEGAKYILGKQRADGSWSEPSQSSHPTWDTCFALLFLRRATRPLADVASEDRVVPRLPRDK
jgi:hypothetical protein